MVQGLRIHFPMQWTSPVSQTVQCLHTTQETWIRSLSREDLLEKEMETHFSILAWKILRGGAESMNVYKEF